eukprot:2383213-Prymnesium_polylepis.1
MRAPFKRLHVRCVRAAAPASPQDPRRGGGSTQMATPRERRSRASASVPHSRPTHGGKPRPMPKARSPAQRRCPAVRPPFPPRAPRRRTCSRLSPAQWELKSRGAAAVSGACVPDARGWHASHA